MDRGPSLPKRPATDHGPSLPIRPAIHNNGGLRRSSSMETFKLCVYTGDLAVNRECVFTEAAQGTHARAIVRSCARMLHLNAPDMYELAETFSSGGQICKERRLDPQECPVKVQLLWPRVAANLTDTQYHFFIRRKNTEKKVGEWQECAETVAIDTYLSTFLQPPAAKEYQDLCNLPDLNETTLLANLKQRFYRENIYTYVGSILIAVNPFKYFPIYNPKYVSLYQNRRLGELPPHVFAVADLAYHAMLQNLSNQCIVISGESGSGKTESANLLLHHLSALAHKGHHASSMEQSIISAGPVLEAFGNAKTVHNNNSSRFGKFIQVNYTKNGSVHGAVVEKYLLEKSRIVSQAENERNYHVFYYLLAGAEDADKENISLTTPSDYFYLNQSGCWEIEGEEDERHEFLRLCQSMDLLGFSNETQHRIFSVLSAVLHLGNIEFHKRAQHIHHESVTVQDMSEIQIISKLLEVPEDMLLEALTKKKTMAGGEAVIMQHKLPQANAARDAMSKCLYASLFDWIVLQINRALLAKQDTRKHSGNSIGVLDIFGFEDFACNSFEQFCINYANEHLHYYFNQHIFRFEQEEYMKEGIHWENIEFIDNTECLDLFSRRLTGLLYLLDEQCNFPGATDKSLLQRFHEQHAGNAYYEEPKLQHNLFNVIHYAGKVNYSIKDFLEKNNDHIRHDIVHLLKSSSLRFVRDLVGYDPVAVLRWAILRAFFRAVAAFKGVGKKAKQTGDGITGRSKSVSDQTNSPPRLVDGKHSSKKSGGHRGRARLIKQQSYDIQSLKILAGKNRLGPRTSKGKTKPPSVSAQFSTSLQKLMETLSDANPFFIRCIKSNSDKAPMSFDEELVLRQLRYTGMLATVRIRQSGYNYRLTFEEFIQQYQILLPCGLLTSRKDIEKFLNSLDLTRNNYQIGTTKVFLREREKLLLDDALHKSILQRINCIQHWYRGILSRRQFIQKRQATITLQSNIRTHLAKKRLEELRLTLYAAITIQRYVRGFLQRHRNRRLHSAAVTLQKYARSYLASKRGGVLLEEDQTDGLFSCLRPRHIGLVGSGAMGLIAEEKQLAELYRPIQPASRNQRKTQKSFSTSEMPKMSQLDQPGTFTKQILSKSVSEESLRPTPTHRHVRHSVAPLAREESFTETTINVGVEVRKVTVSRPSPAHPVQEVGQSTDEHADGESSVLSPFQRLKFKFMHSGGKKTKTNGEESDDSNTEETESQQVDTSQRSKAKQKHRGSKKRAGEKPEEGKEGEAVSWTLSSTSQWQYPNITLITSNIQLQQFIQFVFNKFAEINKDSQKDSVFDTVFKESLKKFHVELMTMSATSWQHTKLLYKDLMIKYEGVLRAQAQKDKRGNDFPMTLAINAFRSYLDEFHKKRENKELPDIKIKKPRKKKENIIVLLKHQFILSQFSITTYCEFCHRFIWMTEKALSCRVCKYTLHKKCSQKTKQQCSGAPSSRDLKTGRMIGIPLSQLVSDKQLVPQLVEKLIDAIETKGLYSEGIYRKPGAAAKIRILIDMINQDLSSIDFCDYQVNILAAVMKTFLRELPEPVMTFGLYDDFMRVTEVADDRERTTALYVMVNKLPVVNHRLLQRIIFHLTKVAQQEQYNKMSANNLAIIFAPSLLRTRRTLTAQDSLKDVSKQTLCIETILLEQLTKVRTALANIDDIENARMSTQDRLHAVRASQRARASPQESRRTVSSTTDEELYIQARELSEELGTYQQEKAEIVEKMTQLDYPANSSDEDLLAGDSTADELDEEDLPSQSYFSRSPPPKHVHYPKKRRRSSLPESHFYLGTEEMTSSDDFLDDGDDPLAYNIPAEEEDEEDSAPMRSSLTAPELKQVGDEIMV